MDSFQVECLECGCVCSSWYIGEKGAVKAAEEWNTRSASTEREIKHIKKSRII